LGNLRNAPRNPRYSRVASSINGNSGETDSSSRIAKRLNCDLELVLEADDARNPIDAALDESDGHGAPPGGTARCRTARRFRRGASKDYHSLPLRLHECALRSPEDMTDSPRAS
jgi:hypothetical protein